MITVLKIGGSVLEPEPAPELMAAVARALAAGEQMIIVHGGGKALSGLLKRLGVETVFQSGLRVTDPATLRAAVMAFGGEVNTSLVGALNRAGVHAVGLTGLDGGSVTARVLKPELGAVGSVETVDVRLLQSLLAAGFTPTLAPLASDGAGGVLNVNADQFAAGVAGALGARRMLFVTDVPGVLDARRATIPEISLAGLESLAAGGAIHGGMLPKADACRAALEGGAAEVHIIGVDAALALERWLAPGATPPGTRVVRA